MLQNPRKIKNTNDHGCMVQTEYLSLNL